MELAVIIITTTKGYFTNQVIDSRFKKRYCPFKNILKTEMFFPVTHKMTVIRTLVNHIGPIVVNTH